MIEFVKFKNDYLSAISSKSLQQFWSPNCIKKLILNADLSEIALYFPKHTNTLLIIQVSAHPKKADYYILEVQPGHKASESDVGKPLAKPFSLLIHSPNNCVKTVAREMRVQKIKDDKMAANIKLNVNLGLIEPRPISFCSDLVDEDNCGIPLPARQHYLIVSGGVKITNFSIYTAKDFLLERHKSFFRDIRKQHFRPIATTESFSDIKDGKEEASEFFSYKL